MIEVKQADLIRRGFVDVQGGQVHYRMVGQPAGIPLVLMHPSPGSGLMLAPLLQATGKYMWTIALDTRGNGDSEPLSGVPEIEDFADAAWEAIDGLGIDRCYLLGSHTGASIAVEASLQQPTRVRGLIIDNMGLWSEERRGSHILNNSPQRSPDEFGSQFHWAWHYCRDQYLFSPWYEARNENRRNIDLPSPKTMHEFVVEVLKAVETYHMSYSAAARYPKREKLARIRVPTIVSSNNRDPLIRYIDELHTLVKGSTKIITGDIETPEGAAIAATAYRYFLAQETLEL